MTQHDSERLKARLQTYAREFPLFRLIGFELIDLGPRWSVTRIALREDLKNPNGVMHGGILATLIDTGIAQSMLMTDEYQRVRETKGSMSSVDLRVRYLRPLSDGCATCRAEIEHLGRRIGHASAVVKDDQGRVVALGESIVMITLG